MDIREARSMKGAEIHLICRDRHGVESSMDVEVVDIQFRAYYGPCLITTSGEISLDRVVSFARFAPLEQAS